MRTYDKRIGFLVSYQTLIPHGGIGQFTKSFCELMDDHNIKVDIITDKNPSRIDAEFVKSLKANIIYPDDPIGKESEVHKNTKSDYGDHSSIFMYGDTFCYERMANFRNAIVKSLEHNLYDAFICNTYETVQVASTMGLEDVIQIIAYTHLESQIFKDTKNPFLHSTNEMMRSQLNSYNIYVGTQSVFNEIELRNKVSNSVYTLPIPLSEKGLLEEHIKQREGVLFVGRWEEGKNPELFLELIEQTKLPAKVMTSANGAKKFEERLKKIGVPYEIKVGIIGQEKVDFMTSARVAFNPSIVESYGMAFQEQMTQMPTVALENMRWTQNFNQEYFYTCTKQTMAKIVTDLYNEFDTPDKWYKTDAFHSAKVKQKLVYSLWMKCLNAFHPKESNSNTAKILQHETVKYGDFIKDLGRKIICIDDCRSALTNRSKTNAGKFSVIYTDDNTYLTKDPSFEPEEDTTGTDLFQFV